MGNFIDLTGQTFKGLYVIKFLYKPIHLSYYLCRCLSCGKEVIVRRACIKKLQGCKECSDKRKILDITGQKYGRLLVLSVIHQKGKVRWRCLCDCGKEHITSSSFLINGNVKSCGCLNRELTMERNFKHGMTHTPEHKSWVGIIQRTTSNRLPCANRYINRGITVCDSWRHSFQQFYKDMGARPSPEHSIDRINNNGNYEPNNCRWATPREQANNRSTNIMVEIEGEVRTIKEWSRFVGISSSIVYHRIYRGWSPIDAIMIKQRNAEL